MPVLFVFFSYFQDTTLFDDLFLLDRVFHIKEDDSYSQRISLLASSFEIFKSNPFFGSGHLINNHYPHNFLIETAISTGLFGSLLYLSIIGYAFYKSVKLICEGECVLISFFFLQYLLSSFLSGSLFLANAFWILIAVIFSCTIKSRNYSYRLS